MPNAWQEWWARGKHLNGGYILTGGGSSVNGEGVKLSAHYGYSKSYL